MNTAFRESFDADLSAITDAALLRRIRKVIEQVEAARNFGQIPNLKRLEATGKYYRIRVGDYQDSSNRTSRICQFPLVQQCSGGFSTGEPGLR